MDAFLHSVLIFFRDMLTYTMIAIFLENTIFSRALGSSTALFVVRKKYNVFLFGTIMTAIITMSSLIIYFIHPLIKGYQYKYYITPLIYMLVIGIVYIGALLLTTKFASKHKAEILQLIHVSAFNCAVLGGLMISSNIIDLSLGGYLGFGIGTGLGFTLASFFLEIAYERLSSEHVPIAFRGFPITLIYIGIVSLAIYGLIGHELPF